MRRDIKLYVNDILDATLAIEKFVEDINKSSSKFKKIKFI
ncbi:MAG: hypothetical protein PWQ85_1508 [Geotoga sp.]|nr:hypothetical protein [Geotoga sp.]